MGAASAADPRDATRIRAYGPPAREESPDWYGIGALGFGMLGMSFRYRLASWVAAFFCAGHLANLRAGEIDVKQTVASVVVAVSGIVVMW